MTFHANFQILFSGENIINHLLELPREYLRINDMTLYLVLAYMSITEVSVL